MLCEPRQPPGAEMAHGGGPGQRPTVLRPATAQGVGDGADTAAGRRVANPQPVNRNSFSQVCWKRETPLELTVRGGHPKLVFSLRRDLEAGPWSLARWGGAKRVNLLGHLGPWRRAGWWGGERRGFHSLVLTASGSETLGRRPGGGGQGTLGAV